MPIAPAWQLSHAAAAHKDKVLHNAWCLAGVPISLLSQGLQHSYIEEGWDGERGCRKESL